MSVRSGGPLRGRSDRDWPPAGPGDLRRGDELLRLRERRARERMGDYGPPRRGPGGFVRFVLFAAVLAVVVVVGGATILRPIARAAVVNFAGENPGALHVPFVADLIREDIGDGLVKAASADTSQVPFTVVAGDSATSIADRLKAGGLLTDARAFIYLAVMQGVESQLEVGDYVLRRNMTPDQLVGALLLAIDPAVTVTLREGLRIEQITAKLETLPLQLSPADFYALATKPSASLLASVPWLKLPEGASLEGFLYADTYRVRPDTTAEEFIRLLLDRFHSAVGDELMTVPATRRMSFYQVVALASLVEEEAVLDAERPLIAGVYQNRITKKMLLNADPTLIYANDTVALKKLPIERWREYVFWEPLKADYASVEFPKALAGYQTYKVVGLQPGPICTPSLASIKAALAPTTGTGYLYFVAKHDGSNSHAFAKTYAAHLINLRKYGYL